MKFNELSEDARQKAIAWYAGCESQEFDGTDSYEGLEEGLKYLGITVTDEQRGRNGKGQPMYGPAFEWSGFCSQGDGLVFRGNWSATEMKLADLLADRPQDVDLMRIGQQLLIIALAYPLATCRVTTTNYGPGLPLMGVDECFTNMIEAESDDELPLEMQDTLQKLMRDAAAYCYAQLEAEYEYRTGEEQAIACIENNEYEFDADGERT
jgi:hypothetical protein